MSIYTNKKMLVADDVEDLHVFAMKVGLMSTLFFDNKRRCFYAVPGYKLREIFSFGALIRPTSFVEEQARVMKKLQMTWYKTCSDEEIAIKINSWGKYVEDVLYNFEGKLVPGKVMAAMTIEMFKAMRDDVPFSPDLYIQENSIIEQALERGKELSEAQRAEQAPEPSPEPIPEPVDEEPHV